LRAILFVTWSLPPDQYVASLARKRMAATAFSAMIMDRPLEQSLRGRRLLDTLSAGPRHAPEAGISQVTGAGPGAARRTRPEITEIVLADGELAGFAFVAEDEVAGLVTPLLARRVASCLGAVAAGMVVSLENSSLAG
jgi:hypothetical protein